MDKKLRETTNWRILGRGPRGKNLYNSDLNLNLFNNDLEQISYLPGPKAHANNWSARHWQITVFCDKYRV